MNDMNETLAEIRRRGETRIRARKQLQRRVTALCVPLVLCAAAVLTIPTLCLPTYEAKPEETMTPAVTNQSTTPPHTQAMSQEIIEDVDVVLKLQSLKIEGENLERCVTDEETIAAFRKLLNGWDSLTSYTSQYAADEPRAGLPAKENTNSGGIRLTLTEGEETWEYILYSESLYDVKEKVNYPISHAQYTAMMNLLGLELP